MLGSTDQLMRAALSTLLSHACDYETIDDQRTPHVVEMTGDGLCGRDDEFGLNLWPLGFINSIERSSHVADIGDGFPRLGVC